MQKLRVASCQLPVTQDVDRNAEYVGRYMEKASAAGAHLLHTSEACLSGYAGADFTSFTDFDWERLRWNTACLRDMAAALNLWYRARHTYLIDPQGAIVNRYDKSMCTGGDQQHYSAGNRLVVEKIRGV